jgi:small subunit ribosomal protein S16
MPVKIRLSRHGRKKRPYYHIVVTDSRAPRDGRYIEKIGMYNPNTNPATIELDFDKTLSWVQKGAQPTDTCRAILSYKGVMYKKHLMEGVKKNAFSEEEAETRYAAWSKQKEEKIQSKRDGLTRSKADQEKARLEREVKINEARAAEFAKQRADMAKAAAGEKAAAAEAAEAAEAPVAEAQTAEVVEQAVKEETAAKAEEAPKEEPVAKEEEVAKEEPAAKAEEPAAKAEEPAAKAEEPAAKAEEPAKEEPTVKAEEATKEKSVAEAESTPASEEKVEGEEEASEETKA